MGGSNVLNGLICFYKPRGIGSTNVVRYLQSVLNCHYYDFDLDAVNVPTSFKRTPTKVGTLARKVGHGGTLDPLAEGCLVLGVGDGTKILNKFLNCTKVNYSKNQ
jgi:tRNA pseudouridine55 synthase